MYNIWSKLFKKWIIGGFFPDINPGDFSLMQLNEIILSLVLPWGPFIYYFMLCCFFSHFYLTATHPWNFPCNFFVHFPGIFMNTLKTHSFSFTSFCFCGLIKLLLKIPLDQKKRCWALDTGRIKFNCYWENSWVLLYLREHLVNVIKITVLEK